MKKFDLKSMLVGVVTGSLLFGGIVGASTLITDKVYVSSHAVTVDGKTYNPENILINYADTTYVPLREFGTITGSSVSFANGTIIVKKPTAANTSTNTDTSTTKPSTDTTKPTSSLNNSKLSVDLNGTNSFYVDLNAYGSNSATIAVTSGTTCATVSKKSIIKSEFITVTGKKEGSAIIQVAYNNGYTDVISVTVAGSDEIKIEAGDYGYIEVDLDEYEAKKANLSISSGGDYVLLDKKEVSTSGKVKVKGRKAGEAKIKVKYDTGDTEVFNITVTKAKAIEGEIEVSIDKYNGKFVYYIDLDEYEANKAKVTVDDDDDCITAALGSTTVSSSKSTTSSKELTITGKDEGEAEVKVEFLDDDGDKIDTFYIYVTVIDDVDFEYDEYDYEEDLKIDEDDYDEISIDPEDYDAEWATISIITGTDYISTNKTSITTKKDITITGDYEGEGIIQVTYSTGDVEYYYVEVIDD